MDRRQVIGCLLVSLAFMAGCTETETPSHSHQGAVQSTTARPLVRGVTVATIAWGTLPEVLEAVGTVRSRQPSVVSSQLVARVLAVHVNVGERVQAGQVLVELDPADVKAQVQKAEAGRQEAEHGLEEAERGLQAAARAVEAAQAYAEVTQTTLKRYEGLLSRHLIAPQEYDETAARHKAAAAELARAQAQQAALLA